MNSDNERIGRDLIQAWKTDSVEILVGFDSAMRDDRLRERGWIVNLEDNLLTIAFPGERLDVDLEGARFVKVGTKALFIAMNLPNPERYGEWWRYRLATWTALPSEAQVTSPISSIPRP